MERTILFVNMGVENDNNVMKLFDTEKILTRANLPAGN